MVGVGGSNPLGCTNLYKKPALSGLFCIWQAVRAVADVQELINESALQTKLAFGYGVMGSELDLFTSSPVLYRRLN
jgi:hypothetical protein